MLVRLLGGRWFLVLVAVGFAAALVVHPSGSRAASIQARPVRGGLQFPAAFTFAPDGKIFYGERFTGEIHIIDRAAGTDRVFARVTNLATEGEQGLLGVALHPDYPDTPSVYVFATRLVQGDPRNHIIRFTRSGGSITSRVIFRAAAGGSHNGGRILFGPDRRLYAVIGELGQPSNAQDLSRNVGKVLRMTAAGGIPADNPFADSRVFSYGLRNSFGAAFDPVTGRLWETENGPRCNDELNRIRRGGNFAWGPSQTCQTPPSPPANTNRDGPNRILPERFYTPTTAPTGAVFCSSCGLGPNSGGRLFFGEFNTGRIRRVTLGPRRLGVVEQSVVLGRAEGILGMERAPRGTIFFSDRTAIYRLVFQ
ncbi:MAG: PQQ-dependent sugar dehydrogenase [Actinomycetota bacterium]